jgi:NAD(P)-dependent dehydrogenase (short-subunit alcohol dehydrogenase family)
VKSNRSATRCIVTAAGPSASAISTPAAAICARLSTRPGTPAAPCVAPPQQVHRAGVSLHRYRVVNIGSGVTRIAVPGELAYAMTKAALETLTRNLADDLGSRGITVNTVAPAPPAPTRRPSSSTGRRRRP